MDRSKAKKIAEVITNEELSEMLQSAKESIKDWEKPSPINKGLSMGTAWNILAKDFDPSKQYNNIVKYNMVRTFGKYLPKSVLDKFENPKRISKPEFFNHQEPIF